MSVRAAERRRSTRHTAAYPTVLVDLRGNILARGRSANISEHGLFVIVSGLASPLAGGNVVAKVSIPATAGGKQTRIVVYECRIVRRQALGQLVGLGVELCKKLG